MEDFTFEYGDIRLEITAITFDPKKKTFRIILKEK